MAWVLGIIAVGLLVVGGGIASALSGWTDEKDHEVQIHG
jgi:hypothetical protein